MGVKEKENCASAGEDEGLQRARRNPFSEIKPQGKKHQPAQGRHMARICGVAEVGEKPGPSPGARC